MKNWIDGGYKKGESVVTEDGLDCVLKVSLGCLGWIATNKSTGKEVILLFCKDGITNERDS